MLSMYRHSLTLVVDECNLERVAHEIVLGHNWIVQGKAREQQCAWTRRRERHCLKAKSGVGPASLEVFDTDQLCWNRPKNITLVVDVSLKTFGFVNNAPNE